MSARIAVVNTRAANIHSVEKALSKVGASHEVVSGPSGLLDSDAAVLPGVGLSMLRCVLFVSKV